MDRNHDWNHRWLQDIGISCAGFEKDLNALSSGRSVESQWNPSPFIVILLI